MPIRERRGGYQIDVFVKGCKRVRHQFDGSKRDAEILEMEIRAALMKTGSWSPPNINEPQAAPAGRPKVSAKPTILDAIPRANAAWGKSSEKYRKSSERNVREALEILGVPDMALDDLGYDELGKLAAEYKRRGLAKAAVEYKFASLRTLYTAARQRPALTTYRPDFVEWIPKGKVRADRVLTDDEEDALLKWCLSVGLDEFHDMCILALDQALHAGEVSPLTVECFEGLNTNGPTMHVPGTKTAHRAAPLPMTKRAVQAAKRRIAALDRGKRHLFPTYHQNYPAVDRHWQRFREFMDMEEDPHFTFKILRHTCGTRLAEADINAYKIRDYMRHANIKMTERYIHTARGRLRQLTGVLEGRNQP